MTPRRLLPVLVAFLLAAGTPVRPSGDEVSPPQIAVGTPAPHFETVTIDGRPWSLGPERGRALLIEFGSVFCIACRQTLGMLEEVRAELSRAGIDILHVNVDGPGRAQAVKAFLAKERLRFDAVTDREGEIGRKYGMRQIPFMVLVGTDGLIARTHVGMPEGPSAVRAFALAASRDPAVRP